MHPMTDEEYNNWWPLHHRHATGEKLTKAEQAAYEAGIAALDADEHYPLQHDKLRAMRRQIEALRERIREKSHAEQALETEIRHLEARYEELTGRSLSAA